MVDKCRTPVSIVVLEQRLYGAAELIRKAITYDGSFSEQAMRTSLDEAVRLSTENFEKL